MVRLRVLTTDDWPLWRDIRLAALAEAPRSFKSRLEDWHCGGQERWRARLDLPGAHNIVAFLRGQAVGMASGLPVDSDTCELRSVWVGPEARGCGVGDLLVAVVEAWARRSGATAMKLAVIPGNEPAVTLYQRHGFDFSGEFGDLVSDDGVRERLMVKILRRQAGNPG
ncbi:MULTISPECIES: GNAT family N-acetyltransferase [unclassified Streptomyces]|uniref:GNAT family N-acetyltransferase n=1 Tax=unclassified Streptomyces TaxID=2593676 RepID=UPI00035CCBA1|nr:MULTISPECIES: GNAT family N-acetyltransferase [unclassified Streptomyces]MYT33762.1 GNAT family N-acetyltransferase [Streptomyces sp. SID8354]